MLERKKYRQHWKAGSIIQIDLDDGSFGYAQVLESPLVVFYDYKTMREADSNVEEIVNSKIAFKISVMKYCVTQDWKIIGKVLMDPELDKWPDRYRYHSNTQKLFIHSQFGPGIPAIWEECKHLECAAVWDSHSVEQRLRDYFAGRPCFDVESMKPGWVFIPVTEFYKKYGYEYLSEEERLTGKKSSS